MSNLEKAKRIYNKDFCPMRKLFLWGWDNENNPSFIVLYGLHEFKKGYELQENITYTDCMIFRGKGRHFPSFEAVKILNEYNYQTRKYKKRMYYKKDIEGSGYWQYGNEEEERKEFKTFQKNEELTFPYFENLDYEVYVEAIQEKNLKFDNFKLAQNPNEVLNLDSVLLPYSDTICKILSTPKIYMRKKYLKQLISSNPPIQLYDFILKHGSSELIAGLFLEFSFMKDDRLLTEAKKVINSQIDWVEKNYADGLKRCALLYINSFDKRKKAKTIHFIRQTLPAIDLHLAYINGKEIPADKVFSGKEYSTYPIYGNLSEYIITYSYKNGRYRSVPKKQPIHYKTSYYCDGHILNITHLKNTIQHCELYGLSNEVAKIAYYLDAPRLHYHLRANGKSKALMYFKRYVRRILDFYARNDEDKFIDAIKILFTSYTNQDYLCHFEENFQFNYFIKHYLYHSFKIIGINEWYNNEKWERVDQLRQAEGRYEFMPELWNKHLDDIIDIISESKVIDILKAFYYILNDSSNKNNLRELDYDKLIKLSDSPYEPISDMFIEILSKKVNLETRFDFETMFSFLQCSNEKIRETATNYFKLTNGKFSSEYLAEFMLLENFPDWIDLFKQGVQNLEEDEFVSFVQEIFRKITDFKNCNTDFFEILQGLLFESASKITRYVKKWELISLFVSNLYEHQEMPSFLFELSKKFIFTMSYEDIKNIVSEIEIKNDNTVTSQKNKSILCLLEAIKNHNILPDNQIIELLETGSTEMLKILVELITENKYQLKERLSTLLILFESDMEALNEIAKSVFERLPAEQQKNFHLMLLDSPEKKVYSYGLKQLPKLYGETVPKEFLLQMLEHPSAEVKSYVSCKILETIKNLGNGDKEIFMYYIKTLLFLPNKVSFAKQEIYKNIPIFVNKYKDKLQDVEELLFELGNSNIILDSERALVTLAKIKKEVISLEG